MSVADYAVTGGVPIKTWLYSIDLEKEAFLQATNLAKLPFVFKHVALMPDTHKGYGMPIGGVLATKGVVIPNAVGVDIGCGMVACKTDLTEIDRPSLLKIMGEIRNRVPLIENSTPNTRYMDRMPEDKDHLPVTHARYIAALKQLGTLGGGNHFIEIQKGSDGFVWVMVHSGSRNLGKRVADYYNDIAVERNSKWFSSVKTEWELAFLPMDSGIAQDYMEEMQFCVDYAKANRDVMMEQVLLAMNSVLGTFGVDPETVNIAHNYAQLENHFGHNVVVHRKGATSARVGEVGIIPGSQGSKSYITVGKGNRDSFNSCPHGAGRKMGRNVARKTLDLAIEKKHLDDLGIVHGLRNQKDLDEAAGAYKDIDTVMKHARTLCDIKVELTPMCVIKGN